MCKSKSSVIISVILCFAVFLSSCDTRKMLNYYSDENNYITVVGTVYFINYTSSELYLGFENMSEKLSDDCFKIAGKNLSIAKNNGIRQKIEIGDEVTFVTAPKYFGDGYVMPIVSVSVEGETLLEFNDGFVNLQEQIK